MIRYAVSTGSFGKGYMTSALADAFRRGRMRNVELTFHASSPALQEKEELSRRLAAELIAEGVIRPVSAHLPFNGGDGSWDPSEPDEDLRHEVGEKIIRLIRANHSLLAPQMTLHASLEPPEAEHAVRLDQTCRTIEQLLPLTEELGFSINVEFLPRTCIGNSVEELRKILSRFDESHVGVCFDVNHAMGHSGELPEMIAELAPRIRSFHLSDYDGIDEAHWIPGTGIIDWPSVMAAIRVIRHEVILILETVDLLGTTVRGRGTDPFLQLRLLENTCWFLENCGRIVPELRRFEIPGNGSCRPS